MHFLRLILLIFLGCGLLPGASCQGNENELVFESDVQPVFAVKCGKCHSDNVHKGELNLSVMDSIRRGGESGESLIADSIEDSWLWTMIENGEMPPADEAPLSDEEQSLIRRWIAGGGRARNPAKALEKQLTQHDVLPILLLRCTACHGRQLKEGGLDLRSPLAMRIGGKHGPAIVSGDPAASLMIQRIESEACPPKESLLKFFVRRPGSVEVATLRDWIADGAPEIDVPADVATTQPDPLISDEDRQHWAFQPLAVPFGSSSIDELVLAKLDQDDLTFAPQADRDTLIRRAYLDLVGMPPSRDEWMTWRTGIDARWYQNMIDHLLASPHYGERWGRYWLDLAGYADSEGGISADPIREVAWKYRDYVINAFNDDKPYDVFLQEQLAGDELVDCEAATTVTEEMVEKLVATGFLRMGIDQTGSRTMNFVPERLGVVSDAITIVSSGLMGLTMECARCHTHKYDPIPHRDYYRFKAIFQGALDEHDWLSFKNRSLNVATDEQRKRVAAVNPPLDKELKSLQSRLKLTISHAQLELLRHHYPEQTEADRQDTLATLTEADNTRTLTQKILVEKLQLAELLPDEDQPTAVHQARQVITEIEANIAEIRQRMEPPLTIRALWDRGDPSPTYILNRGEYDKSGRLVGPGVPSVLTDGQTPFSVEPPFPNGTSKTGRRLAFARWLTQPEHPLTSRVMMNRIWHHHFGRGLVASLENFGIQGERPSHPELLDWLAMEFVQQGWSIKAMHRMIMNSRTYRQSSRITEEQLQRDPTNELLSRMPLRRMNAEALRDSLLFVSGQLNETPGGPPDSVSVDRDGLVSVNPTVGGGWRRSVYLQYRRTEIPTMMDTFDYPEMGPNCTARNESIVSPQSLMLMHNKQVHQLAQAFAARVTQILGNQADSDRGRQVDAVYELALSRSPSDVERALGVQALNALEAQWQDDPQAAFETYCHIMLNSAAFLYVD